MIETLWEALDLPATKGEHLKVTVNRINHTMLVVDVRRYAPGERYPIATKSGVTIPVRQLIEVLDALHRCQELIESGEMDEAMPVRSWDGHEMRIGPLVVDV